MVKIYKNFILISGVVVCKLCGQKDGIHVFNHTVYLQQCKRRWK